MIFYFSGQRDRQMDGPACIGNKANCHKSRASWTATDGPTDGPTDRVAYRVACTRLKRIFHWFFLYCDSKYLTKMWIKECPFFWANIKIFRMKRHSFIYICQKRSKFQKKMCHTSCRVDASDFQLFSGSITWRGYGSNYGTSSWAHIID